MTEMNLGSANLKSVNASKPQLLHTTSKQSVTASDEYYSLSEDYPSEGSSDEDRETLRRFGTPPSRIQSPSTSRDPLQSEATIIPTKLSQQNHHNTEDRSMPVRFDQKQSVKRKPISADTTTWRPLRNEVSPPTPGVDDTPYIHFAIDQLTRDEELLGRSRQGVVSQDSDVVGIPAVAPQSVNQEHRAQSLVSDERSAFQDTAFQRDPPLGPDTLIRQVTPDPQEIPVRLYPGPATRHEQPPVVSNILRPMDPPKDTYRYPLLHFIPGAIRLLPLVILMICCMLMIAALIVCSVWSSKHNGLLQYNGVGTSRYFLFEFLPQILASIIIIWLLVIQVAVHRILPFSLSVRRKSPDHGILYNVALFPTNFLIPNVSCFRHGDLLLGMFFVIAWLCFFTMPLQSALFQTRLYSLESDGVWRWTTVQPVAWTLIGLYTLLIIALLLLIIRFTRSFTGLKWDPVSLADIFVLLHRSNDLSHLDGTRERPTRNSMLGYWSSSNRPDDIFYGIGEEYGTPQQLSLENEKTRNMPGEAAGTERRDIDLESQTPRNQSGFESPLYDVHSPSLRYRWTPWFLRHTSIVAWILIAFALAIAFITVSFVHQAVKSGFSPLLPAPTTSLGFSPANFLYSFLPSLLGMILFILWQPIDIYFRALQPFANLSRPNGATAENSLLLNYASELPFLVTFKAALAGHYKVAWVSFISILSLTLPILSGGIFTAQFFVKSQDVREAACMSAYDALIIFVIIYTLSFLVIWPTRKRYLPHDVKTLGDLIDYVHQSPLLGDSMFREPRSKIDLVTRLVSGSVGEKGRANASPKFGFGVHVGRDGKEYLGIDRLRGEGFQEKAGNIGQRV
ncbi:hypothetical protein MMC06_000586 [Schaereria dolodes]|nr:hypothetical protein [Schaereria dolodes]